MTNLSTAAAVLAPDSGTEVLNHLDMLCRVVLSGEQTQDSYAIVEERAAMGAMTPQHVHQREAETFIVLDGALEGWCDGTTSLVEAGSMIHLPAGVDHAFRVVSSSAHFYTLITPAGFERFFPATGVALSQPFAGPLPTPGPVPPEAAEQLQEVLTPLGVTITGPPPFQLD